MQAILSRLKDPRQMSVDELSSSACQALLTLTGSLAGLMGHARGEDSASARVSELEKEVAALKAALKAYPQTEQFKAEALRSAVSRLSELAGALVGSPESLKAALGTIFSDPSLSDPFMVALLNDKSGWATCNRAFDWLRDVGACDVQRAAYKDLIELVGPASWNMLKEHLPDLIPTPGPMPFTGLNLAVGSPVPDVVDAEPEAASGEEAEAGRVGPGSEQGTE